MMIEEKMQIEFTDRYGGNPPSWLRGCFDDCEATGYVPIKKRGTGLDQVFRNEKKEKIYDALWDQAEKESPSDDGYHFVKCPSCKGTGLVSWIRTILRVPRWIVKGIKFTFTAPTMGSKRTLRDIWLAFKCAFLFDLGLWKP
ncbi:MAG: hypothetical protein AABY22_03415 [Nanoarchaeota archaeon]